METVSAQHGASLTVSVTVTEHQQLKGRKVSSGSGLNRPPWQGKDGRESAPRLWRQEPEAACPHAGCQGAETGSGVEPHTLDRGTSC